MIPESNIFSSVLIMNQTGICLAYNKKKTVTTIKFFDRSDSFPLHSESNWIPDLEITSAGFCVPLENLYIIDFSLQRSYLNGFSETLTFCLFYQACWNKSWANLARLSYLNKVLIKLC